MIDSIIDDYCECDELPEEVEMLQDLFEEYKKLFEDFLEDITALFEELEQMAGYDMSYETCRKVSDEYGMEAFDENLDYYLEKAMDEANGEYSSLIEEAESTVRDALESLDSMVSSFQQLYDNLLQLLVINPGIDNTKVN